MLYNPIQFAVVREDPLVEWKLINTKNIHNCLLVGSGGCSALSLAALSKAAAYDLQIDVFDINPEQLKLLQKKSDATLSRPDDLKTMMNIGVNCQDGLNQCGNFERLFDGLRKFIWAFVAPERHWRDFFDRKVALNHEAIFENKYWPVAFELFFHDSLLNTMFGPAATQYAEAGSYPPYFRQVIETGLLKQGSQDNYFLHHILLGHYLDRPECLPSYLGLPGTGFTGSTFLGPIDEISDLRRYGLIQLSNLFDWMSPEETKATWEYLGNKLQPGTAVLVRQLNNKRDLSVFWHKQFSLDEELSHELRSLDRSLFYENIVVAIKN